MEYDDTDDIDDTDCEDETAELETELAPNSSLWYHSTMNTETGAFEGRGDRCRVR